MREMIFVIQCGKKGLSRQTCVLGVIADHCPTKKESMTERPRTIHSRSAYGRKPLPRQTKCITNGSTEKDTLKLIRAVDGRRIHERRGSNGRALQSRRANQGFWCKRRAPPNHIARQAGMSARSMVSGWQGLSWLRVVARCTFDILAT